MIFNRNDFENAHAGKALKRGKNLLLLGLGVMLSTAMFVPNAHALVKNVRCWEDGTGNACSPYTNWRSIRSTAIQARMKDDAGITSIRQFADKLQNKNTTYIGYRFDPTTRGFMNGARDEAYSASEYNVIDDYRQRKLFSLREARAAQNKDRFPVFERNNWWWGLY